MLSKLIPFASLLTLTGCFLEPTVGTSRGQTVDFYDEIHIGGDGPVIIDAYAECWLTGENLYAWYFDAEVAHTFSAGQITSVWVDIYHPGPGMGHYAFELNDIESLRYPLDAPGSEYYGFQTGPGDGVFMRAEFEIDLPIGFDCNSSIPYDIYTTAYDTMGNYQSVVQYL